jgi:hypothetical protein
LGDLALTKWQGHGMDFMATFTSRQEMNKKRIHKLLFYALLFSVYGVFFSVESFYNNEGQPNAKQGFGYSVVKNTPLHSGASPGFRLNKRYHQENIPPCPIFTLTVPARIFVPVRLGVPVAEALPSGAIIHYSLRGPPVTA